MHSRRLAGRVLAVLAVLLAVSFSGMLFNAPAARADHNTVQWNVETPVTSTAPIPEERPFVLADHQGNVYVFYVSPSSGTQANLTVTKYHLTALNSLVLQFRRTVNPTLGSVERGQPISAAIDSNGYLYVAWTESFGFTGGVNAEVMVSRSTDGGNTWPQTVSADRADSFGDDYSPTIVAGTDGTISVMWLVSWGGVSNLAFSQSTNQGAGFGGYVNITSQGAAFPVFWPDMAVDSQGRLYVAYEYWNAPAAVYTLNYTWSDSGATWSAPHPIGSDPTIPAYVPKIAVDSQDHVHVVWYSWVQTPAGTNSVQYRVSTDRGATWSPQHAVNQGLVDTNTFPSIAVTGSTVLVAAAYGSGVDYAVSADGGQTFYPEETQAIADSLYTQREAVDQNGTVWMAYQFFNSGSSSYDIGLASWHAPPSTPVITAVTQGTSSLTVRWTASPEADVVMYRIYRSLDGSNYQVVGTVAATQTSYADTDLANGTYWYQVDAVDLTGLSSHLSQPGSGTVGPTTQELINQLEDEIAALHSQLNTANANLANAQTQLNAIRAQLDTLRGNTSALQSELDNLQNQLNNLQSQQATQTISYANLAFEVIVVVLLVVLLLNQMRKPKSPQMMMAQPAQAEPKRPEDDL